MTNDPTTTNAVSPDPLSLTQPEILALIIAMSARYENIAETRSQTGDAEYEQHDEDECSALLFALSDFGPAELEQLNLEHLYDAVWIVLDTPEAFEDIDPAVLLAGALKLGYEVEDV